MSDQVSSNLKNQLHCQAKSKRTLAPCRQPRMRGKSVCRFHGGKSTGPKTREGKERIRQANLRHGGYSKNAELLRLDIQKCKEANKTLALISQRAEVELTKLAYLAPWMEAFHRVQNKTEFDFLSFIFFGGLKELLENNIPLKNALGEFYRLLGIEDGNLFVETLLVKMDEKAATRHGLSYQAYTHLTPDERHDKFFGSISDRLAKILSAIA